MVTFRLLPAIIIGVIYLIPARAAIVPYALPDPDGVTYTVTVNGQIVPVKAYKDFEYIHFAMDGQVDLVITAVNTGSVTDYRIRPERRMIPGTVAGNTLSFSIGEPQQLVVNVNYLKKLFIFADPPETDPPALGDPGVVNLMDYGADSTGGSLMTTELQNAIDQLPAGGVLYVPAGFYRTGSFSLKSSMTLYLAPGALIKGSDTYTDIEYMPGGSSYVYFLRAQDVTNLTIRGRGALDGNGAVVRPAYDAANGGNKVPGRLVSIRDGDSVTIEGIQLRDSYSWNTHPVEIRNLHIDRVKIINDFNHSNGDGFDIDRCVDALVENSFVYAQDDAITPKASWGTGNPRNNTYRNCVLWSHEATGIRVGAETESAEFSGFLFENIDILHSQSMIRIFNYDGAHLHDLTFRNIWVEDYGMYHDSLYDEVAPLPALSGVTFLVYFYTKQRTTATPLGYVDHIRFENLVSMGRHVKSRLDAPGATTVMIDSVSFVNFVASGRVMLNATDALLQLQDGAGTVIFSEEPAVDMEMQGKPAPGIFQALPDGALYDLAGRRLPPAQRLPAGVYLKMTGTTPEKLIITN